MEWGTATLRHGWPWGDNQPTRKRRLIFAGSLGAIAGVWLFADMSIRQSRYSDFTGIWFGARAILHGQNPYNLIGPGKALDGTWGLFYPGTALILGIPFAAFPDAVASALFIGISVFFLAYGSTRDSWHRLPAFASPAFVLAVRAAQWSPLATAAWFVPTLAFSWASKPTLAIAFFLTAPTNKHRKYALAGAVILVVVSLLVIPSWPSDWLHAITNASNIRSPFLQRGGFLVALALLRWRRREAWILLAMALMPQHSSLYDTLPIFVLIPNTYREATMLTLISTLGFLMMGILPDTDQAWYLSVILGIRNATTFLPALAMILRRPNEGDELPALAGRPSVRVRQASPGG